MMAIQKRVSDMLQCSGCRPRVARVRRDRCSIDGDFGLMCVNGTGVQRAKVWQNVPVLLGVDGGVAVAGGS